MRNTLAICFTMTLSAVCSTTQAQSNTANVLVIVADDLGVDYVGAYAEGTSPPPTPNIDALANRGVLFRNAWANPSCSPTRACIMTGRYPFRTRVGRWIRHLNNSEPIGTLAANEWTLPKVLDTAGSGYDHACIGKWHVHDVSHGLDAPRSIGGFAHFAGSLEGQIASYNSWTRVVDGVAAAETRYCTTQNTDDALAWIGSRTGPWFCLLTYQAPHIPYHAPPATLHTQNLSGLSPASNHTAANRPFYRAMVESLDTEIGRLLTRLGASVVADTNIIFIGDNGSVQQQAVPPFNRNRAKGTPYEGGVNVPLILAGPAVVAPGREVSALADSVDVFASALELAGVNLPSTIPGWVELDSVSLVPYLRDPAQVPQRTFSFTEQFNGASWPRPNQNGHATVRNARYKLIRRYSGGSDELYDLQNDPFETSNILQRSLTLSERSERASLQAIIGVLRTPRATVTHYGATSCIGSNQSAPSLTVVGLPQIGQTYRVDLSSAPANNPAWHILGLSAREWNGIRLPFALSTIGAGSGCDLLTSGQQVITAQTDATGSTTVSLSIPSRLELVGLTLFHQWLAADTTTPNNPLGLLSTDAAAATVGL